MWRVRFDDGKNDKREEDVSGNGGMRQWFLKIRRRRRMVRRRR